MNESPEARNAHFQHARVLSFESRRGDDMVRLIEKLGGVAHNSPSMREIAEPHSAEAVDFAHQLLTGQIGIVVFLTGVGFDYLLRLVEKHVDRQRFLDSLADVTTVARGPKPVAAMARVGLKPTLRVPAPNTWRDVLTTLDAHLQIANQKVAVQEYGQPNPSLTAGLEARGAEVVKLSVYQWDLPEDQGPLEANVQRIANGDADLALFTSAQQVVHLLDVARRMQIEPQTRAGLNQLIVGSIGPTTSEKLRALEIPVDLEPSHSKMGVLVSEAAQQWAELKTRKKQVLQILSSSPENLMNAQAAWYDSPFMKACRREPTDITPVWLMRQAGRYMEEYRKVRSQTTFLELCKRPDLCSEIMCTAVQRLGVDAAIIFSDLLPILEPMGLDLEFAPGEGPVIHNPVREPGDVDRVLELESVDSLHFVMETVRRTRQDLPEDIPLIGFAGAPFTLASYTIEGGASRNYLHTKTLMYRDERAWRVLMERFARSITRYLNAQVAAGAQCVQLFDSWVGCLGPDDYRRFVLPYVKQIIAGITPGCPVISFATGNPALLPLLAETGAAVIGVDWRIRLADAWKTVGYQHAVQGNLDPTVLLADRSEIRRQVTEILHQAERRPGHIFNLGHGVLQQTPVQNAIELVQAVHEISQSGA